MDSNDSIFNGANVHTSVRYDIGHPFQFDGTAANLSHITSSGSSLVNTFTETGGLSNINNSNRLELQFTLASDTNYSFLATVADSFTNRPHATIDLQVSVGAGSWGSLFPTIASDTTEQHAGVLQAGLYRIVANADAPGRSDGNNSASK